MNNIWKSDFGPEKLPEFEHIKRMITLSVITLSGLHCTIDASNPTNPGQWVSQILMNLDLKPRKSALTNPTVKDLFCGFDWDTCFQITRFVDLIRKKNPKRFNLSRFIRISLWIPQAYLRLAKTYSNFE
jgi:hypothetical protein